MKVNLKKNRGITLIALVITIIVLLILAGVSIAMLTGQNGILTQAQNAKNRTEEAQAEEQNRLNEYENKINQYLKGEDPGDSDETVVDGVTIPKGFTHVSSLGTTKEQGIVIEDGEQNQYVWVPVTKNEDGTPTDPYQSTNGKLREGSDIEIQLGRYNFNPSTGAPGSISSAYSEDTSENHKSDYGNMIAKDIENGFKKSVKENGGYYIARFEAGIEGGNLTSSTNSESNPDWTGYTGENMKLVSKSGATVWNYITQNRAANLCRDLADTKGYSGVTSDLMNSYTWDTTIVYIQECGTDNYANQRGQAIKTDSPSKAGEAILAEGNGAGENDVQCNIYDMAGNCWEWTTETGIGQVSPCMYRGGSYGNSFLSSSGRSVSNTTNGDSYYSFRPILYL